MTASQINCLGYSETAGTAKYLPIAASRISIFYMIMTLGYGHGLLNTCI